MAYAYPSQTNVYLPSYEASGKLTIDYSRKPSDFRVMSYLQMQKVTKTTGKYLVFKPNQAGYIPSTTLNEWRWPDGQDGMAHNDNWKEFQWSPYNCDRYKFDWAVGNLTIDMADFDLVANLSAMTAQQCMTARSVAAATILNDSTQFGSTSAVTSIAGVSTKWDVSALTDRSIAKSLLYGAQQIQKATLSAVKISDLHLIINPVLAGKMSQSGEIAQYLAQSPFALPFMKDGADADFVASWGLPPRYQGVRIVVDDTTKNTAGRGSTINSSYVLSDTQAALVARPGSLIAPEGAPSFSFITIFMQEEMTVEVMRDTNNRRTVGRVVENWDMAATAPASGFLFTGCSS